MMNTLTQLIKKNVAPKKRRINLASIRQILDTVSDYLAKELQNHGKVSLRPLGRFEIMKSTGKIEFTPFKTFQRKIQRIDDEESLQ
mmetsp:Transcript_31943/g.42169  ORF Transcript_31943/g.42169 Transcript_31943/m.42169 type:complete len:86 (+) Transcript_31943:133-390(+)